MNDFLDFNSANNQYSAPEKLDTDGIRNSLLSRIDEALHYLLPQGHVQNNCFYIGDTEGNKGKSLVVQLQGDKQGSWFDFAANQGGDLFNLWAEVKGYSKNEFPKLLTEINEWLGNKPTNRKFQPVQKLPPMDILGKPSAEWNYLDKNNRLLAVVYRYDNDQGKQFRIWDIKSRKAKAPDIRPLYNIPGIATSKKIILVEGEKTADALIKNGFTATTAMFGANAPIEKTDWSPLQGKELIIWPDNDEAGISYAERLSKHLTNI
jgi:DNA primase